MGSGGSALRKLYLSQNEGQGAGEPGDGTSGDDSLAAPKGPKRRLIEQSELVQELPKSRPMLARVAEAMYWMSRYVERAEHISRIVLVNSHMLIDLGELAPDMLEKQWLGVLRILRLDQRAEVQDNSFIGPTFSSFMKNESNRNLITCLTKARENARSIRENISEEMWETLNTLYWSLTGEDAKLRFDESPQEMFHAVIMGSLLFQGVADQTLPRSQSWQFIQLAKYLERADMICRIVDTNFDILRSSGDYCETPLRNIQWMGVLRSCCSIEAYRRKHLGDLDPLRLAAFLILDADSPRNIRYAIGAARAAIADIGASVHPNQIGTAERILGRLNARLEYADMKDISATGLNPFLKRIQQDIADVSVAIENTYFLH
jgi:uncharacterized alpha-E superfamily protein